MTAWLARIWCALLRHLAAADYAAAAATMWCREGDLNPYALADTAF